MLSSLLLVARNVFSSHDPMLVLHDCFSFSLFACIAVFENHEFNYICEIRGLYEIFTPNIVKKNPTQIQKTTKLIVKKNLNKRVE